MTTLNFPNSPADGDTWTDSLGQQWMFNSTWNSWTVVSTLTGYSGDVLIGGKTLSFHNGALTAVS